MKCFKKNNKCFPITTLNNDVFEKIDLHDKSKMPEQGWIHSCVNCGLYTASTILFNRSTYINKQCEFWFYLCKHCNHKISDNVKDYIVFSKRCSKMVRKYKIKNLKLNLDQGHTDFEAELPEISIS